MIGQPNQPIQADSVSGPNTIVAAARKRWALTKAGKAQSPFKKPAKRKSAQSLPAGSALTDYRVN